MAILAQPFLFQWSQIDTASDLERLCLVLSTLPDEKLVRLLEIIGELAKVLPDLGRHLAADSKAIKVSR
jgi:hypothetical protein